MEPGLKVSEKPIPRRKGKSAYEVLHLEGIEVLQKLAGGVWSDYNEHDPGVTILENLAYTLTELEYKTTIPICDLLIQKQGDQLKSGDNAFFIPSDILTINPVTLNDYRKVLIDRITNVKNAWVHPVNQPDRTSAISSRGKIKGLYEVEIELYHYSDDQTELKNETNRITNAIRKLFNTHRSLCEQLFRITILKPFELQMSLDITLSSKAKAEEVLAEIFYRANNYMTHDIKFYSLWELREKGMSVNEIFNGPRLENGFILNDDLKDPINEIIVSDVLKVIGQIPAVENINSFTLSHISNDGAGKSEPIQDRIFIPKGYSPTLLFPTSDKDISFRYEGISFKPDLAQAMKQLNFIQAVEVGDFRTVSTAINELNIPAGKHYDIKSYKSIRYQFPTIYGIGEFGLGKGLEPKRYAQAKQLKAYLLPFDQLMANFLSQLSHVFDLYTTKESATQSYFYQELERPDDMAKLLRPNNQDSDIDLPPQELQVQWNKRLRALNSDFDRHAVQRLNLFADSLLARFNETFPSYSLKKFNEGRYNQLYTESEFERKLLIWKRKFMSRYATISYNKARGYNYHQKVKDQSAFVRDQSNIAYTPGLPQKIALFLGIENYGLRPLSDVITNSDIKVYPSEYAIDTIVIDKKVLEPEQKEEFDIDEVDIEELVVINNTIEDLFDALYFFGNKGHVLNEVLKEGVIRKNYRVMKSTREAKPVYCVVFTNQYHKKEIVHVSYSMSGAHSAIRYAIKFLSELSSRSEGIYLLEHLMLAPSLEGENFGFEITLNVTLQDKQVILINEQTLTYAKRNDHLKLLSKLLKNKSLNCMVKGQDKSYFIHILTDTKETLAIISESYTSSDLANSAITELKEALKQPMEEVVEQTSYYAHYNENKVDEKFFSFQMSLVLPNWPSRFQDDNFKMLFESTLYTEAPAHCKATTFWIGYEEMIAFETCFYEWFKLKPTTDNEEEIMLAAYKLIQLLQSYQ